MKFWPLFCCIREMTSFHYKFEFEELCILNLLTIDIFRLYLEIIQGILTTLSQSNGKYKYDYATVPFLAEVFKVLYLNSCP